MIASRRSRISGRPLRVQTRRGSIMTLFAVLLFALLPLMALIIHTGFITLTRRQMQAAVNTGAKEGLRFRDELSEPDRREQVSRLVANLFDDDLNPGNGDPVQFGAGPVLDIAGGQTLGSSDFRASTTVSVPDDRAWKPGLLSNIGDARHGDMVAGDYVYDASDPDHDSHEESSNYTREDFDPRSGGVSFLVRLRRTHSPDGTAPLLDDVANVSSAGPTIPYLFGRVPYGNADGGTSLLDQRERGTIVRATAIAQAQSAKSVGLKFTTAEVPGMTDDIDGMRNVVVDSEFWSGSGPWAAGTWTATGSPNEFETTVELVINGSTLELRRTGTAIGRLIDPPGTALTVGLLNSDLADSAPDEVPRSGFVAILTDVDRSPEPGSDQRIVGFGYLKDVVEVIAMPGTYTLTRVDSHMPLWNTSASFQETAHLSDVDLTDLMSKHHDTDLIPALVGAPAMVRTIE